MNGRRGIGRYHSAIDCHKGRSKGKDRQGTDIGLAQIAADGEIGLALKQPELYYPVNNCVANIYLDDCNRLGTKFIGKEAKRQAGQGKHAVGYLEPFDSAGSLLEGLGPAHGEGPHKGADHRPEAKQGCSHRHLVQP